MLVRVYACRQYIVWNLNTLFAIKEYTDQTAQTVQADLNLRCSHTRVLQKVLSLGSYYFSAAFYQTYFYYKPSKYFPFTETHFCNLFTQSRIADK